MRLLGGRMDKDILMDKLFCFLRGFPEFKNLNDMIYDERNSFVRANMDGVEKIIEIHDESTWMNIVIEVLSWFVRE